MTKRTSTLNAVNAPTPPEALAVPTFRYWGSTTPPKNKADFFSHVVAAAGEAGGETAAATGSVATIRMYGPIDSWGGWWGISAKDVSEALDAAGDVDTIVLRINSPGGEVFEGLTILNMFRAHGAHVIAVVDGLAASAASFIAAGCHETVMSPGTQMMIHDASAFAYGPADDMRKAAEALDSISDAVAGLYAEAAGGTDAEWRTVMKETVWYTAAKAVEAGLADRVGVVPDAGVTGTAGDDPEEDLDEFDPENRFDLSMYKPPAASAAGSTPKEGSSAVAFTDEQITGMRQTLGLAEDADEATILAALDEALDERAEDPASTDVPAGHVVIPEARLKDLETAAQAGASAAQKLLAKEREDFLDAVRTKFAPANRDAWAREYDRNPEGTRKTLTDAADIIGLEAFGHEGQPNDSEADDVYAALYGPEKTGA